MDYIQQRAHGINIDSAHHGGLAGVGFGNDEAGNLFLAGFKRNGKRAPDAANTAVEREFADEEAVFDGLLSKAAVGAYDAESHGQIEAGAFFLDVRGARLMVMWVGGMS